MTSVFDYNIVGNPKIFEQNRLMPHTEKKDLVYDSESDEWISNRFLNLNGVWEFCYSNNYNTAPKFFEEIGYDCKAWERSRAISKCRGMMCLIIPIQHIRGMERKT